MITVDNGSTDNTYDMLNHFNANFKLKIIKLEKNMGRAYARNVGIENASGDILIFHDSDMLPTKHFVIQHLKEHKDSSTAVCGMFWGRIFSFYYEDFSDVQKYHLQCSKIYQSQNQPHKQVVVNSHKPVPLLHAAQIEDGSFINLGSCEPDHNPFKKVIDAYGENLIDYNFPWSFFITNNCSASRQSVVSAGLFDNNYLAWGGEDYDLGYRLFHNGCKFVFRSEIISLHQEHPSHPNIGDLRNSFYLCEKFDSIDMLLYLFCKNSSIDCATINTIIDQINELQAADRYSYTIGLFNCLLKLLRERARDYIYNSNKNAFHVKLDISLYPDFDIERIKKEAGEISKFFENPYFMNAFHALLQDIFYIDVTLS